MKRKMTVIPLTASMFCSKIAATRNAAILGDYRCAMKFAQPTASDHGRALNAISTGPSAIGLRAR